MIDTQRLGALLRALIREDAVAARLRVPGAAPVRPTAAVGPELPPPRQDDNAAHAAPRNALEPIDDATRERAADRAGPGPRVPARLSGELPGAATQPAARGLASAPAARMAADVGLRANPADTPPPRSAALELSDTGRLLLAALRGLAPAAGPTPVPGSAMQPQSGAASAAARGGPAPPLAGRSPLISVPPHSEVATDRLALQLKDAVEFSGVFYEAHLAQWADDLRPRALLAHEPQSRWPVANEIAQQVVAADATAADYATPLLRQQLDVLDTGRFVWRGELWPGQPGMLVIEEEEPPPQRAGVLDAPTVPRWRMRLSLTFPRLGAIDATVALAGESVDLSLHCDDPATVPELRSGAPVLRLAIAERALDLSTLTIRDDRAA